MKLAIATSIQNRVPRQCKKIIKRNKMLNIDIPKEEMKLGICRWPGCEYRTPIII